MNCFPFFSLDNTLNHDWTAHYGEDLGWYDLRE
jgi:hypothetical protein